MKIQYPDLFWESLSQSVECSSIFIITTQTHGAGSDYLLMKDVVKYLHQNEGFSVLCMASSFFDGTVINRKNKNISLSDKIKGSLFRMYANSLELEELFKYMELKNDQPEETLHLEGVDIPMGGVFSKKYLLSEFICFCEKNKIDYKNEVDSDFFKKIQNYIALETMHDKCSVSGVLESVKNLKEKISNTDDPDEKFWILMLDNIEARVRFTDFGTERDLQIANNFRYIKDNIHKGKKIIIWGHACHCLPIEGRMGGYIKEWYGNDVHFCHLTSNYGEFLDFENGEKVEVKEAEDGFFEKLMESHSNEVAFLGKKGAVISEIDDVLKNSKDMKLRIIGYHHSYYLHKLLSRYGGELIDSIIFSKKIIPTVQI